MLKRDELTDPNSCLSRAKDDEMCFVLLGRDYAAPLAIVAWIDERIRLGKNMYKLAQQGALPGHKVGRSWRFDREEVDASSLRDEPDVTLK